MASGWCGCWLELGIHGEDIGTGANKFAGAEGLGRDDRAGLLRIRDNHRSGHGKAGGLDSVDIEFGEDIAPLDLIALGDVGGEVLTLEVYRIESDMHEDIDVARH